MSNNISNMTLKQLKKEYAETDNNTPKKVLLGKIIKQREEDICKNKLKTQTAPQQVQQSMMATKQNAKKNKLEEMLDMDISFSDDEENSDFLKPATTRANVSVTDPKFKAEIERDHANNMLMDRLNSELAFRTNGYNKEFVKPYLESGYQSVGNSDVGTYIDDFNVVGIPSTSFSAKAIFGLNKNKPKM